MMTQRPKPPINRAKTRWVIVCFDVFMALWIALGGVQAFVLHQLVTGTTATGLGCSAILVLLWLQRRENRWRVVLSSVTMRCPSCEALTVPSLRIR